VVNGNLGNQNNAASPVLLDSRISNKNRRRNMAKKRRHDGKPKIPEGKSKKVCVRMCQIKNGTCLGCNRTIDEIIEAGNVR
jgi:hypothetical protein